MKTNSQKKKTFCKEVWAKDFREKEKNYQRITMIECWIKKFVSQESITSSLAQETL